MMGMIASQQTQTYSDVDDDGDGDHKFETDDDLSGWISTKCWSLLP